MNFIMAIDPGTKTSGLVVYDDVSKAVRVAFDGIENALIPSYIHEHVQQYEGVVVVEWLSCYGARVGSETFETCWWSGRFAEAALENGRRLYRKDVVRHLLGGGGSTGPGRDSAVRAVILDRFGPGRTLAIGTKSKPGPLYYVKGHAMQALAVAVTWSDGIRSEGI